MGIFSIIGFHLLFLVGAFVFASVGMGGAAFYIPVMLLFGYEPDTTATTCLVLNIVVASISFVNFRKYFNGRYFYPVIIGSIPGAFIGGLINVNDTVFVIIVIAVMLLTAIKLFVQPANEEVKRAFSTRTCYVFGIPFGFVLGIVSGIIGIGGGIFLAPLLILAGLVLPRTAAALAALFIVINSAFALAGHLIDGDRIHPQILTIFIVVIIGGLIGGYLGSTKLPSRVTQWILGVLIVLIVVEMCRTFVLGCM